MTTQKLSLQEKRVFRGLSRAEAAAYIGVSPTSFDRMITEKLMPSPRIWHARRIWDVRDLDRAFEDLPYENSSGMITGWEEYCDGTASSSIRS